MGADAVAKRLKPGQKILAANAPSDLQLGAVYSVQDLDRTARINTNLSGSTCEVRMVKSTSSTPLNPGQRVIYSTAPTAVTGAIATDNVVGYVDPWITGTIAQGDVFLIYIEGPTRVVSGGAFIAGAVLGGNASGQSTTGGTYGPTSPARAIGAASGAGQLVRAYVNCSAAY